MAVTLDRLNELNDQYKRAVAEGIRLSDEEAKVRKVGDETKANELDASFKRTHEECNRLSAEIERELEVRTQEAKQQELAERAHALGKRPEEVVAGQQDADGEEAIEEREESKEAVEAKRRAALDTYLRWGVEGCSAEERTILNRGRTSFDPKEVRGLPAELRAQAVGQGTLGGFMVPQGPMQPVLDARKQFGGMRAARTTKITTSHGQEIPFPTNNDTTNKGRRIGENKPAAVVNLTVGQVKVMAYLYTSDYFLVPFDLLQDVEFPLEPYLFGKLGERNERILNEELTIYDGATGAGPEGIVVGATVGKQGASGQTTSILDTDLDDLEHSVDPAYRVAAEYMFNDQTFLKIKKLKDGDGRRLWSAGMTVGDPANINGYRYIINQDMPDMAASAKPIVFGDMSAYYIRDVSSVIVMRLTERFAEYGQVAFLLFSRHDGKLLDAGTNPIKAYQNAAS